MIERQPYLPRFMAGGPGNPLGARAMYLSGSVYRIHGTNAPQTIGQRVSSGCIRLTNEDVSDLYARVTVGAKVVVLPMTAHRVSSRQRLQRQLIGVSRRFAGDVRMTPAPKGRRQLLVSTAGYRYRHGTRTAVVRCWRTRVRGSMSGEYHHVA